AGAVGLSYGYHLQRGGAEVCYFVREKYAEAAREGFTLYALNAKDRTQPLCFQADQIVFPPLIAIFGLICLRCADMFFVTRVISKGFLVFLEQLC
ncbi:MAG: hypothetical protein HOG94_08080, partial [Nitrospinaceae bacterium]|nr:hypothetical protein [Nitrospinaceae bacterium]